MICDSNHFKQTILHSGKLPSWIRTVNNICTRISVGIPSPASFSLAFPRSFPFTSWKSPFPFVISDSTHWLAFLLHFCKEGYKLYEFIAPQTWIYLLLWVITEIEKLLIYLHPPYGRAGSQFFLQCSLLRYAVIVSSTQTWALRHN